MSFDPQLQLGELLSNSQIASRFGCDTMNGIRPSKRTQSIVLITGNAAQSPYKDRWEGNLYQYTGMGKYGPQAMSGRNLTLAQHEERGLQLFVFHKHEAGKYEYLGEFELAAQPVQEWQPDLNMAERLVWLYPLAPIGAMPDVLMTVDELPEIPYKGSEERGPKVAPSQVTAETIAAAGDRRVRALREYVSSATMSASSTALDYVTASYSYQLQELASSTHSHTLRILAEQLLELGLSPLESNIDLAVVSGDDCWLFEVKSIRGGNIRRQTRMAVGQLLDYRHFESAGLGAGRDAQMAVVYSTEPPADVVDFLASNGFHCFWITNAEQLGYTEASWEALEQFASRMDRGIVLD